MHSLNVIFKTHVQGKQMYVGLHHMVLQSNIVCVYVRVPKT
jgi:archaellum biogenesis protein FlaJ (TadC family)